MVNGMNRLDGSGDIILWEGWEEGEREKEQQGVIDAAEGGGGVFARAFLFGRSVTEMGGRDSLLSIVC